MTLDELPDDGSARNAQGSPSPADQPSGLTPGVPPAEGWPPAQGWPPPQPGWPPAQGWPPSQPGWPPAQGWPPSQPGWPPGYGWPPAQGWAPPGGVPSAAGPALPTAASSGYAPGAWAYPYAQQPAPLTQPPGKLHPATPPRRITAVRGRAAPRMYATAWLLTIAGIGGIVALIASAGAGLLHSLGVIGYGAAEAALVALATGLLIAALAQGRQRRADGWQDYFGPSPFLLVGAWLALGTCASLALAGLIALLDIRLADSVWTLLGVLLNLALYVGLVQIAAVRPGALTWNDMARPKKLAPDPSDLSFNWSTYRWTSASERKGVGAMVRDLALGLGLGIPLMIGTLVYIGVLALLLGLKDIEVPPGPVPTHLPGWDIWIILLAAAVIAPIGEEIFFRGLATNAWARSLQRNPAVFRAAILFASVHVVNILDASAFDDLGLLLRLAILAVAGRIPVAWALTWIYARRRSIYASMALHATYNGSLVVLVWWVGQRAG